MSALPLVLIVVIVGIIIYLLARRARRDPEPAARPPDLRDLSRAAPAPAAAAVVATPVASRAPAASQVPVAYSAAALITKLYELAFGITPLPAPPPAELEAVGAAARTILENVATQPRYAPRRPLLLPQLLQAVNDSDVSRRQLAGIIARDPALAGALLKLANSPFYRASERPVESVDRAVAVLGTDGIRSLVATVLLQPVFRLSQSQFAHFPETIWEHTYRMAAAAEAHSAIVEDSDPFAAQLLGLTLGLGTIVVFRVALDQYSGAARPPDASVIAALLDAHAAPVARSIAASWDLSERILAALEDQARSRVHSPTTSLGRSLRFGHLMGALALLRSQERIDDESAKATMLALGATASQFERIWTRLTTRAQPKA